MINIQTYMRVPAKDEQESKRYSQTSIVVPAEVLSRISKLPIKAQRDLKKSLVAIYEHIVLKENAK